MTQRIVQATAPITVTTDATNTTIAANAATTTAVGVVELATTAEATTGTDTTRAVTAAGVKAVADTKQPLDADLTAIAALTTTATGRSLLTAADAAAIRAIDGSIAGIRVEDEGASTVAVATALNFVGAGVTVTDAGAGKATVTVTSGGGGISGIVVKEEGVSTVAVGTTLNFVGGNVTVTDATGGEATITLTGATTAQGATADAAVPKALYDANTVLYATTDNTPAALVVGASTVVGRKATGDIVALTASEQRTVAGLGTMATEAAASYLPLVAAGAAVENIGAVESNVQTGSVVTTDTLDTSLYGVFDKTMTGITTFTFSNPAPSGKCSSFVLILRGAFTPTLPATVDWGDAAAPTYTTPSVYVFTTVDAGTTWLGSQVGKAFA